MLLRLTELQKKTGLTQPELASQIGVSTMTLQRWAYSHELKRPKALAICRQYGCSMEFLTGEPDTVENTLGSRIQEIRGHLGLKKKELAARLGVTAGTITNWEKATKIPPRALENIAKKCGVNLDWLKTGEGAMFKAFDLPEVESVHELARLYDFDYETVDLLARFTVLPEKTRAQFENVLASILTGQPLAAAMTDDPAPDNDVKKAP